MSGVALDRFKSHSSAMRMAAYEQIFAMKWYECKLFTYVVLPVKDILPFQTFVKLHFLVFENPTLKLLAQKIFHSVSSGSYCTSEIVCSRVMVTHLLPYSLTIPLCGQ